MVIWLFGEAYNVVAGDSIKCKLLALNTVLSGSTPLSPHSPILVA